MVVKYDQTDLSTMFKTTCLFLMCLLWTAGPPHDLQITEVRSDSLVLIWKPPVYQGRDPVNGFYIDIKEADAPEEAWRGVNNKATDKTFIKVCRHQD